MDWNSIWGAVTAVFTAALFILGWWQLHKINKTTSADFLHRFVVDFFTPDTRYLIMLIDMGWIVFDNKGAVPIFQISKNDEANKIAQEGLSKTRSFFTVYEIDDLLLGQFEDMANLERKGVVEMSMIYSTLSWYLQTVWKNKEIEKYIKWLRDQENCFDVYDGIDYLFEKCNEYGEN